MTRATARPRRIVQACALAGGVSAVTVGGLAWALRSALPPAPREVQVGAAAPEVHLADESGDMTLRSELEGHPTVVVLFRGSACPYCRKELGRLAEQLAAQPAEGVRVIGISPDPPEAHAELRRKLALPFALLSDREDRTAVICHFAMHCVLLYDTHAVLRWAGYAETWSASVDYGAVLRAARGASK